MQTQLSESINTSIKSGVENLNGSSSTSTVNARDKCEQHYSSPSGLLHKLLHRFGGKTIYVHDQLYLTRYYLLGDGSGRGFEVYVHHMHAVDSFRWLHNHPWHWFLSFVFRGSYEQDTFNRETSVNRKQTIRWFNLFRGLHQYHAIRSLPKGHAYTLVIAPPKIKDYEWGYWDDNTGRHIPDNKIGHESAHIKVFGSKVLKD